MNKFSNDEILMIADRINAMPRKRLAYHTPEKLFDERLDEIYDLCNF